MTFRGVRQDGRVLVTRDGTALDWRASLALRPIAPTGVEWGYSGAGPRQLAHALLLDSTDQATADRWCSRFYCDVTSRLPPDRWVLDAGDILAWIEAASGQRSPGRMEPDQRPSWARRRAGDHPAEVRLRFRPLPRDEGRDVLEQVPRPSERDLMLLGAPESGRDGG